MPSQNSVRCEQGSDLLELFAAKELAFDCQSTSLVIGQQDSLLAELLFKNGILGAKVLNDVLLLSIDPTGQDQNEQLPRFQTKLPPAEAGGLEEFVSYGLKSSTHDVYKHDARASESLYFT